MFICWLKEMCMSICGCYCKYHNEFCYNALVNDMIVIFSSMVIVNTVTS